MEYGEWHYFHDGFFAERRIGDHIEIFKDVSNYDSENQLSEGEELYAGELVDGKDTFVNCDYREGNDGVEDSSTNPLHGMSWSHG